jgi:hypothetical protein
MFDGPPPMLTRGLLLAAAIMGSLANETAALPTDSRSETSSPGVRIARSTDHSVLHSNTTSHGGIAKAATDSFYLYGGPGTNQGRFEGPDGRSPDRQGWIGVDLTDVPTYWQVSTFNAANLNNHGVGNLAAWCGQTAVQQPSWTSAPGYGNSWFTGLQFMSDPLSDPSVGQTVDLDFFFNYDTERGGDFFRVDYDSAGTWIEVFSESGTNSDAGFAAPGVQFTNVATAPIAYVGNDYGGPNGDQILIRLLVQSDSSWSDEDGAWPSIAGAVQVDDISVSWSDGSAFEDFEGGTFTAPWRPDKRPFAGDFSKVWTSLRDGGLDECQENFSPVMAFVDGGQTVGNASSALLIQGYPASTSGTTSANWSYGVTGEWVVSFDGGLSGGETAIENEVWSPEIAWDLPGSTDDGAEVVGALLRFSVWNHLPLQNGIFYVWHIRSTVDGSQWGDWRDRNFLHFGVGTPRWQAIEHDVTDLLPIDPIRVQMALGVTDLAAAFGFPGLDATPSPAFDNVALVKYQIGGPSIVVRVGHLANDGFPISGGIDASTAANRNALDVPFDMAQDIATLDPALDPGDSVVIKVVARIPGTSVSDIRMVWVLDKNPLFEDAIRSAPSRAADENVVTGVAQWTGEVVASISTTGAGVIITDQYYVDLPDADFLYPGDRLRYYIRSVDSDGRVTTLPDDTTGLLSGVGYQRTFSVNALPSIIDAAGTQPSKLVVERSGGEGEGAVATNTLRQLGMIEGIDFDIFSTRVDASPGGLGQSSTIGSSGGHGATTAQLLGYDTVLFLGGSSASLTMSDGSNTGNNTKADDIGVLTAWHTSPGIRNAVYFGDGLVNSLVNNGWPGSIYATSLLSLGFLGPDVRDAIGSQLASVAVAADPNFSAPFVAFGGCPSIRQFDSIQPMGAATIGHVFTDPAGLVYPNAAASVIHDRLEGGDRKVDIVFPFAFSTIYDLRLKQAVSNSARTEVLREVFTYFGVAPSGGEITAAPTAPGATSVALSAVPNPFNPRTVIRFAGLPTDARGSVRIYDLRGALVATLHDGEFTRSEFVWSGTDDNGAAVSSGVYFVDARAEGVHLTRKVALVR